jgi:hypothetical protein
MSSDETRLFGKAEVGPMGREALSGNSGSSLSRIDGAIVCTIVCIRVYNSTSVVSFPNTGTASDQPKPTLSRA